MAEGGLLATTVIVTATITTEVVTAERSEEVEGVVTAERSEGVDASKFTEITTAVTVVCVANNLATDKSPSALPACCKGLPSGTLQTTGPSIPLPLQTCKHPRIVRLLRRNYVEKYMHACPSRQ